MLKDRETSRNRGKILALEGEIWLFERNKILNNQDFAPDADL